MGGSRSRHNVCTQPCGTVCMHAYTHIYTHAHTHAYAHDLTDIYNHACMHAYPHMRVLFVSMPIHMFIRMPRCIRIHCLSIRMPIRMDMRTLVRVSTAHMEPMSKEGD